MHSILTIAVLVFCGIIGAYGGTCVMTQNCTNPDNTPDYNDCIPQAANYSTPQPMRGEGWANSTGGGHCKTEADCHDKGNCIDNKCVCQNDGVTAGLLCNEFSIQCPQYKDNACCTWQQNRALADNFKLIATIFGHNEGGGCDACAANLMNLWCGIVCSPAQSEFLALHLPYPSINYRTDSMTGVDQVKVLELDMYLSSKFTCSLFESCKYTPIASLSVAMKSSIGFLNYQAQTGAVGHGEYFHLHFGTLNSSRSYFSDLALKCDNYTEVNSMRPILPSQAQILPSIQSNATTKQCPCGACRQTCNAHSGASINTKLSENPISIFKGLNASIIGIIYGVVGIMVGYLHWKHR